MKFWIFLTLIVTTQCYAGGRRVTFTGASAGVTTYTTGAKSLIASEVGSMVHWDLYNYTPYDMDCVFTSDSINAPSNGNGSIGGSQTSEIFLLASERLPMTDFKTRRGTSLYCRGDVSAPTVGEFVVNYW